MRKGLWFRRAVIAIGLAGAAVARYGLAQSITEFPIPTADSSPQGIAAGSDAALWFTERTPTRIGRITTSGVVTEFPVPPPSVGGGFLGEITRGPDGAMWFGEVLNIGRIDMSGNVTHYRAGGGPQALNGITVGPDGALWFTLYFTGVGRLDPSGTFTSTYYVFSDSFILGLAFDREGQFWVTVAGQPKDFTNLRRITPSGQVTDEFTMPDGAPIGITAGPDGAMWFASGTSIGRIVSNGAITTFPIPTPNSGATDIISGPDGALWFTESSVNKIGRITTDGIITEYPLPPIPAGSSCEGTGPGRITAGPDGGLWFTEPCLNRIGHLALTGGRCANGWGCDTDRWSREQRKLHP